MVAWHPWTRPAAGTEALHVAATGSRGPATEATATPSATPTPTPTPTRSPDAVFTIVAAGDVLTHAPLLTSASDGAGGYNFAPLLDPVKPWIARADLALCHLETPIVPPGQKVSGYPVFGAPAAIVPALRAVPACPRPAESRALRVAATPAIPRSMLWLEAVEQPSQPWARSAGAMAAGAPKTGYPLTFCPGGTMGVSRWHRARSARAIQGLTGSRSGAKLYPPAPSEADVRSGAWVSTSPAATIVKTASGLRVGVGVGVALGVAVASVAGPRLPVAAT